MVIKPKYGIGGNMFLRRRLFAAAAAAVLISPVWAQDLVLAVNEGTTYQDLNSEPVRLRYQPLLDLLSSELKRPVKVLAVEKYENLEKGLAEEKYDIAFIHPAHIALRAVKAGTYDGICTTKGFTDYRARVLVLKDSPIKTMQDLRGKKLGAPSADSITTVMLVASLQKMGMPDPGKTLTLTRYQDAVPFMISQGFVDAGVTGSEAVEKEWKNKGGRVLGETRAIPIKDFIASKKLTESDRNKVQAVLLGLANNEAGKAALGKIGVGGFVPWDASVMGAASTQLGL